MNCIKFPNKKITFESFLSGVPARDYVFQNMPYKAQIQKAKELLAEVEYVLLGAGAGMSAAAGAVYSGAWFEEHFREKYGEQNPYMQDMYSAGFYPYPDEEAFWGYWSKQAVFTMFCQMDQARRDCRIPSYMVPKCPVCGGPMAMNLRCDQYFVQDAAWYEAERRFGDFMGEALESGKKICLLELGVGFNTPTIIRYPFEKLLREHSQASLVRLNLNEAVVPESLGVRAVGINADMKQSIKDIMNTKK